MILVATKYKDGVVWCTNSYTPSTYYQVCMYAKVCVIWN